jgi:nicotinic acid mononucleotide adenylyltransferase
MIIALKEITEWNASYKQPNHTYLVDGRDNVIAYKKWHKGKPIFSTTKFLLNKRYRKFVEVDAAQFKYIPPATPWDTVANTKIVIGSKGDKYMINLDEKTCTCNGFKFRGKCKHLDN